MHNPRERSQLTLMGSRGPVYAEAILSLYEAGVLGTGIELLAGVGGAATDGLMLSRLVIFLNSPPAPVLALGTANEVLFA